MLFNILLLILLLDVVLVLAANLLGKSGASFGWAAIATMSERVGPTG